MRSSVCHGWGQCLGAASDLFLSGASFSRTEEYREPKGKSLQIPPLLGQASQCYSRPGKSQNENEASHAIKITKNSKLLKVTIRVETALVEVPNLTVHCRNSVSPLAVKRQLARRGVSGTAAPCLPAHAVAHFTKIMLRLASAEMEALGNLLEQI